MKSTIKKVVSVTLVFMLALICCTGVLAEGVEPRWKELSTMSCSLTRTNGLFNNASLSSHASSWNNDNTIALTVTIQKWNGSSYINTSYSWTDSGKGMASVNKNVNLASGNYIAHAVATVYNSSGSYVETVTLDSSEIII